MRLDEWPSSLAATAEPTPRGLSQLGVGRSGDGRGVGASGDTLLPAASFGGSGVPEIGAYRASDGTWRTRSFDRDGSRSALAAVQFGASGDLPLPGDYDGDGVVDEAVYRPSNGTWYV